jgi:quercetin dioxygenase-like cupin family protein
VVVPALCLEEDNMCNDSSVVRHAARANVAGRISARRLLLIGAAVGALASMPVSESLAQGRGRAESWWVAKTTGGVYTPPMRPIWRKADLLRTHAGQNTWSEQIIRDPEQDATYNSGAPGTKYGPRMHPDTPSVLVVIQGQLHFDVEGQQPVTATRGAIINIMKSTVFSYDVTGDGNALWVEVNPTNYKTVHPSAEAQPAAPDGAQIVKVAFSHTPAPYTGSNKLMVNTFDDYVAKCQTGAAVVDDHIWNSPLLGYVNAADNKCGAGTGNIGSGPIAPGRWRTSAARPTGFSPPRKSGNGFPNASYGEDYSVALRISRVYEIGRIYEPIYFARRWEGNSDAALPIVTANRYDAYKDHLRAIEILARKRMNQG